MYAVFGLGQFVNVQMTSPIAGKLNDTCEFFQPVDILCAHCRDSSLGDSLVRR